MESSGAAAHGDPGPVANVITWIAVIVAMLSALGALASGPGNRFGWWDYRAGFSVLRWAAWGGVAGAVLSLAAAILNWRRGRRLGLSWALSGLIAGTLTFALPLQMVNRARSLPPIHDITTDTDNPPRFVASLPLRKGAPNTAEYAGAEIARQQKRAYPDIVPLALAAPPRAAFERCLAAARTLGWEITAAVPEEGRIEAVDRTAFFGFQDDIVIRVAASGTGSRVDVRSLSRVGRSDIGTNAKRIRGYLGKVAGG